MTAQGQAVGAERRRLVLIFGLAIAVVFGLAAVAIREVNGTRREVEEVLSRYASNVLEVARLHLLSERLGRQGRSFLLTGDAEHLEELSASRRAFEDAARILSRQLDGEHSRRILASVEQVEEEHERAVDRAIDLRRRQDPLTAEVVANLERELRPARQRLDTALAALSDSEERAFEEGRGEARFEARASFRLLIGSAAAALLLAAVLAWALSRTLAGLARSRAALDASLAHLERANRDLDAFAGRIAHDLRNILAPLPLTAQRIRSSRDNPAVIDVATDRIIGVARRAGGLMDALLAFSRAGQPPEDSVVASVRQAADQAVEDLGHVRALVAADLRIDVEDAQVRCAPSLLYTVVANVLSNAFKFVEGRPRREVRVSGRQSGANYELEVEDSGPGIPVEEHPWIFAPFYRSPQAKAPGTGIGLATVQRIVDGYGGQVTVRSRMDEGTTFTIRLPLAPPRALEEAAGARLAPAASPSVVHP